MPEHIRYHNPNAAGSPIRRATDPAEKERRTFYNSARWRKLRAAFFAKASNRLCVRCATKGITEPATVVHHVKERNRVKGTNRLKGTFSDKQIKGDILECR